MGLPHKAFFPDEDGKKPGKRVGLGKIVKAYNYTSEHGTLLFQVVRYEPKAFRQRRPDGNGGYIYNLDGVGTVLYRLPEVLQAKSVLIVEGEKDVETAYTLGLPDGWAATCNPMGAEKWKPQYTESLRGKAVYLLPDDDKPGWKHITAIALDLLRDCQPIEEPPIRMLTLPDSKDLTAWVEKGGTTEQFHALLEKAQIWQQEEGQADGTNGARKLTLISADTIKPESTTWVYEGRIPERDITIICGDPDVGKSMITHDIAARLTRGQLEGVYKNEPINVLLASAEDSASHTIIPRFIAAGGNLKNLHIVKTQIGEYDGGGFKLPDDLILLVDEAKRVSAKILIIDPLMSHLSSELNANNDQHIRQALGVLPEFAAANDMTFIIVCHLNKNESSQVKYRIGGSLGIFAVPRSVLLAGEDPEDEEKRVLVHIKCNVGEKAPTLSYSLERRIIEVDGALIETGGIAWHGDKDGITAESVLCHRKDPETQSLLDEAIAWLESYLGTLSLSAKSVLAEARKNGYSEATVRRARKSLGVEHYKCGFGKDGVWSWRLPPKGAQPSSKDAQPQDVEHLSENIGENDQKHQQNAKDAQDPVGEHLSGTFEHLSEPNIVIPNILTPEEALTIDF